MSKDEVFEYGGLLGGVIAIVLIVFCLGVCFMIGGIEIIKDKCNEIMKRK